MGPSLPIPSQDSVVAKNWVCLRPAEWIPVDGSEWASWGTHSKHKRGGKNDITYHLLGHVTSFVIIFRAKQSQHNQLTLLSHSVTKCYIQERKKTSSYFHTHIFSHPSPISSSLPKVSKTFSPLLKSHRLISPKKPLINCTKLLTCLISYYTQGSFPGSGIRTYIP